MDDKKVLFIYNPNAGKGVIPKHLDEVTDIFEKAGYSVGLYRTQAPGDGPKEVTEKAELFDLIVCSGGDGTLSGIVSGMMKLPKEQRKPIGFIPTGSTNDTGKSYGLPKSIGDAARIAVEGKPFTTDIGHFNDTFFTYVASLGKLSAVSCFTPQEVKKRWGYLAYLIEGIKVLLHLDAYDLKITYEDTEGKEQTLEGNFFLGMITNTYSVGGFNGITGGHVDLQDGLFEVVLCKRPRSLGQFSKIVDNLFLAPDKDSNNELVTKFKTGKIKVESRDNVQWVIDGENAGKHKCVDIENDHHAIDIMVDKNRENV